MFIVQNRERPEAIRNALRDLMRDGVESVRVCSAYMTRKGSELLHDDIKRASPYGDQSAVNKTIVTSPDFGITEPEALEYWMRVPGSRVLVAGADLLERNSLNPKIAFHPKLYAVGRPNGTAGSLVGSANLTSRGLTVNGEVAWLQLNHQTLSEVDAAWESITRMATPLTQEILHRYRSLRELTALRELTVHTGPVKELQPVPQPDISGLDSRDSFEGMVADPESYDRVWIQADNLQGGSGTQLELPRSTTHFFGVGANLSDEGQVVHLAELVLVSGQTVWDDRKLTWHPGNKMVRMNLPSITQGGHDYRNSLILFRRLNTRRFELQVHPWDSDSCRAFVEASRIGELLFRVGRNSDRLYGLLP